jgi:transposase
VKIIEILRLWEMGLPQRQIADSVNCGRTTVGEIIRRCKSLGIDCARAAEVAAESGEALRKLVYPAPGAAASAKKDPDWKAVHERLMARRRINLRYIWEEEYRPSATEPMSYSQFCRRYGAWLWDTGKKVVMPMERMPGHELCVDWVGDVLEGCVADAETGGLLGGHIFVAVLGDSSYPYAEAFPDESQDSWIAAHIHALEWLGGVPAVIKPDNCKTAVTKPDYYDPVINAAYLDFSRHYGTAIVPARVRRPRDKAPVESSVGYLETWLMEWLAGKRFDSYGELNGAIRERVLALARRPYQKRAGSREEAFRAVDKPALRPLPASRYERAEYIRRAVPDNYHVECKGFQYSVPHTLYRQTVTIRVTDTMVEVLDASRARVALHQRKRSGGRYATDEAHMPERHRRQREAGARDGASYRRWAAQIGAGAAAAIDALLRSSHAEQTAYKSCMGVLQLAKKHGNAALDAACRQAAEAGDVRYAAIKERVELAAAEKAPEYAPLPRHGNLRDPSEFN